MINSDIFLFTEITNDDPSGKVIGESNEITTGIALPYFLMVLSSFHVIFLWGVQQGISAAVIRVSAHTLQLQWYKILKWDCRLLWMPKVHVLKMFPLHFHSPEIGMPAMYFNKSVQLNLEHNFGNILYIHYDFIIRRDHVSNMCRLGTLPLD